LGASPNEDELGGSHQPFPNPQHLPFATTQSACQLILAPCQIGEKPKHNVQILGHPFPVPGEKGSQLQILKHRHVWKDSPTFWDLTQSELNDPVRRKPFDSPSVEFNLAREGREES
jgi:hypothetical protein